MLLLRRRARAVWSDPTRSLRTLESFEATEADGARDIANAAKQTFDPQLATLLTHHAADERRHAQLFRRRANELRSAAGNINYIDRQGDLSRARAQTVHFHNTDSSRKFNTDLEISYLAKLHVAEERAAKIFEVHRDLTKNDDATSAIFEEILRDEQFHVSYTRAALERYKKIGRGSDVHKALRRARGSRLIVAWKSLGARSGAGLSKIILNVLYFTIIPVFVLFAKIAPARKRSAARYFINITDRNAARSQYL